MFLKLQNNQPNTSNSIKLIEEKPVINKRKKCYV